MRFDRRRSRARNRKALPGTPRRSVIEVNLQRVHASGGLVSQLRKLRGRNIDLLVVRLRDPVENEVTVARVHEGVRGDRIAVGIGSREQRRGRNRCGVGAQNHIRNRCNGRAVDLDLRRGTKITGAVVDAPSDSAHGMASGRGIRAGVLVGDLAQQRIVDRKRGAPGQRQGVGGGVPARGNTVAERAILNAVDV